MSDIRSDDLNESSLYEDEFLKYTVDLSFDNLDIEFDNQIGSTQTFLSNILSSNYEPAPTLDSILNEDDEENDEILNDFLSSLTTLNNGTNDNQQSDQSLMEGIKEFSQLEFLVKQSSSHCNSSNNNLSTKYNDLREKNGIICKHTDLKQISSQLLTAIDRSDSGLATCLAIGQLIAVGTSRGLILLFDLFQILKLYIKTEFGDAICAMSFNNSSDRLLAGNSVGYIFMFDTSNGKCLRQITDAHAFGNAILNLKFTDDSRLACFSDSGGSVFMLEFKRVMGVRSAHSTCLFSGSKGEVCAIEPLKFEKFVDAFIENLKIQSNTAKKNLENVKILFNRHSLLAMASFTKIFVVALKPKLTVLFTFPLNGNPKYLPIINWQLVIMQKFDISKRYITPILACARDSTIQFFQVDYVINRKYTETFINNARSSDQINNDDKIIRLKFLPIQKLDFSYRIYNFCWLSAKTLAILDHKETLHICDVRSQEELQVIPFLNESVQLIFNNCFFKSLATGGYVSEALAFAGESACYQTFQSYFGKLFMLGTKSITLFSLQTWSSRIDDFVNDNSLDLALNLGILIYKGEAKALIGLPMDMKLRNQKITDKIIDILYLYVNRAIKQNYSSDGKLEALANHYRKCSSKIVSVCITIQRQDFLFDNLYNVLSIDKLFQSLFFESLEEYILDNKLKSIPPSIIQSFIDYYSSNIQMIDRLEKCLLNFEFSNLDLHNVIQLCRKYLLFDAYIHIFNKGFNDYISPLEEIIIIMKPQFFILYDIAKEYLKTCKNIQSEYNKLTKCGNKLLVYIHNCLCGQNYPFSKIEDDQLSDHIRHSTFDYLLSKRNVLIEKMLYEERIKNGTNSILKNYINDLLDENSNAGNYPIIRILLNYDISSFLNVISMTFNEPSFEAVIGLEKKQQFIDILIEISFKNNPNYVLSDQLIGNLFTFLARQIANKNNNIQVDNQIFAQLIEYLCNKEEIDRAEEREQTLIQLLNSYSLDIIQRFNINRLLHLSLNAKFYRVCEILYEIRGEFYEIIDCYLNKENSLDRQQQIFAVTRSLINILYELNNASSQSGNDSHERNTLISSNLNFNLTKKLRSYTLIQQMHWQLQFSKKMNISIEPRSMQLKKLREKLIRKEILTQLLGINSTETVRLLWIEMNFDLGFLIRTIKSYFKPKDEQKTNNKDNDSDSDSSIQKESSIIKSVLSSDSLNSINTSLTDSYYEKDQNKLLYKFMIGLFDLVQIIKIDRKYINYMSQFAVEYCEIFVDLISYYEPEKLLHYFKTILIDYSYRVEECLRICRNRKVWDAAAYLLEKSGQIEAAFTLDLEKVVSLIKDLQKKLELLNESDLNLVRLNIDAQVIAIVQICQRNSCSLNDSVKEKIWFTLFNEVMKPIGSLILNQNIQKSQNFDHNSQYEINVRKRLNETKDFFKYLGLYIINSMVGYMNLTTIIDHIIYDPLYNPSNLGDVKNLLLKMLEMCSYENTLFTKTFSLVSKDVFYKMLNYKKLCSRSISSSTNFCLYCLKSFNLQNEHDITESSNILIYYCGHSFHSVCLKMINLNKHKLCPICGSSNSKIEMLPMIENNTSNIKRLKYKSITSNINSNYNQLAKRDKHKINHTDDDYQMLKLSTMKQIKNLNNQSNMEKNLTLTPVNRIKLSTNDPDNSDSSFNFNLTDQQLILLKSIRTRNHSYLEYFSSNINNGGKELFKKNLKLAPANIFKYV